jgi:Alpha/beta hydrolase domain
LLAWERPVQARVKKIVIDTKVSPAFDGATFDDAGQYETLAGRVFGEIDPNDPHNTIITDIRLAPKNANGKVEYIASFFLVKPIDMSKSSRLMWHDVPNRGGRLTIVTAERNYGDVGLSSGWQGDNSGNTIPGEKNDYAIVPVAKNPDGSPITGLVMGRIVNANGIDSRPMIVNSNPVPYKPASLDTTKATLTTHASETIDGKIGATATIPSGDWAWAKCSATSPFPGTPDPTQICLKNGFDSKLLYQVVFTAQDPYVLGIGFAAFRDTASFFKNATHDDEGTPNPLAKQISWVISRGRSQSGNFLRALVHLGFTQDEDNRKVYDGVWPIIAGRRLTLNSRFALPDGALKLYEAGGEGPQWWGPSPDEVRGLPPKGILDRCTASNSCPKIIEHFGAAEAWGLNLSPAFVGTTADKDILLPSNVRRYYIPSTHHGGGSGGFNVNPAAPPSCPGPQFRPRHLPGESGSSYGNHERPAGPFPQLGDEGHASAGEQVPDSGGTVPGGPDERSDGISHYPGRAGDRTDWLDQPAPGLRLGSEFQLCRRVRCSVESAPDDQARDQDEGPSRRCGRERARRGASGPAGCAARHVSGLEYHGGRLSQKQDMQLCRWNDPICQDQSRTYG